MQQIIYIKEVTLCLQDYMFTSLHDYMITCLLVYMFTCLLVYMFTYDVENYLQRVYQNAS